MLFSAIAMVAFAGSAFACNEVYPLNLDQNITSILSENKLKVKINLGDLNNYTDEQIIDIINKTIDNIADEELECSVTVSGSVSAGFASAEISVTVSGPCSEISKKGKAIANQLLADLKAEIKKALQ